MIDNNEYSVIDSTVYKFHPLGDSPIIKSENILDEEYSILEANGLDENSLYLKRNNCTPNKSVVHSKNLKTNKMPDKNYRLVLKPKSVKEPTSARIGKLTGKENFTQNLMDISNKVQINQSLQEIHFNSRDLKTERTPEQKNKKDTPYAIYRNLLLEINNSNAQKDYSSKLILQNNQKPNRSITPIKHVPTLENETKKNQSSAQKKNIIFTPKNIPTQKINLVDLPLKIPHRNQRYNNITKDERNDYAISENMEDSLIDYLPKDKKDDKKQLGNCKNTNQSMLVFSFQQKLPEKSVKEPFDTKCSLESTENSPAESKYNGYDLDYDKHKLNDQVKNDSEKTPERPNFGFSFQPRLNEKSLAKPFDILFDSGIHQNNVTNTDNTPDVQKSERPKKQISFQSVPNQHFQQNEKTIINQFYEVEEEVLQKMIFSRQERQKKQNISPKGVEKKRDFSGTKTNSEKKSLTNRTNKSNPEIIALKLIFEAIDTDNDGLIFLKNVDYSRLTSSLMNLIKPIFIQSKELITLNFEEFSEIIYSEGLISQIRGFFGLNFYDKSCQKAQDLSICLSEKQTIASSDLSIETEDTRNTSIQSNGLIRDLSCRNIGQENVSGKIGSNLTLSPNSLLTKRYEEIARKSFNYKNFDIRLD